MDAIKRKSYYRIAYILMIFSTVFWALTTIVGLAWAIPMTLKAKKAYKEVDSKDERSHTALGVWSFFMMGVLSSIFVLLASNAFKALDLKEQHQRRNMLYRTAYQLMSIATGLFGLLTLIMICSVVGAMFCWIFLIPLAWAIPMTLRTKKAMNQVGTKDEKKHTALAVCSMIFVNFIPGIISLFGSTEFQVDKGLLISEHSSKEAKKLAPVTYVSKKQQLLKLIPLFMLLIFGLLVSFMPALLPSQWEVNYSMFSKSGNLNIVDDIYVPKDNAITVDAMFAWYAAMLFTWVTFILSIPYVVIRKENTSKKFSLTMIIFVSLSLLITEIMLIIMSTENNIDPESISWEILNDKNIDYPRDLDFGILGIHLYPTNISIDWVVLNLFGIGSLVSTVLIAKPELKKLHNQK